MQLKNDESLQGKIVLQGKKIKTPVKSKPLGGKALQRLLLYEDQRGLPSMVSPASVKKTTKGKALASKSKAGANASEAYANESMKTAMSSQKPVINTSAPTGFGPFWRFLGPTQMSNGQTYGDSRVIVSGRVSCIAIDPSNSNHILCGSAGGGVWESFDKGTNWAPRTDYAPSLTTGALAFAPSAPATVYCGTGEGNFYSSLGAGVLKSTDGGTNWTLVASSPFVGVGFYELVVDSTNANRLMSATGLGVHLSTNGGVTWTSKKGGTCWSLSINKLGGSSAEIIAAFSDGVYRTVNWGTTWTKQTLTGAPASFGRLAVAISRSNPAVAYAFGDGAPLIQVPGGNPGDMMNTPYLWKRTTAGGTFSAMTKPSGINTSQDWYDWFLGVSPANDSEIYIGTIEAYRGTFSSGSWTWVTISNKAGDDIHPDQHAIAIDNANANNIFVGCDGGLFYSSNKGTNWISLNPGLGITEIEYMAQDYGSSRFLIAGTQDNGSIRYTGNLAWDHIADGDGGDCGVNRATPNTVYHSFYSMGMERSTTKGDFGSFSWIGPNVPNGYSALFYPPLEVYNDTVAQAGQSVYISRNKGTTFTNIALPAGNTASALYIPNADTVFVGTDSGNLYKIRWVSGAWSAAVALTKPRTGSYYITDIYVNSADLNRIWVTIATLGGGRVFGSSNGGTTWTNFSAGLPNLPINAIEVQPDNQSRIWVSADIGVYQSLNGGTTWANFSNGLPNALTEDLLYHPHARVLRVGLRNRGVWEIPVDGWLANPICGTQFTGTLLANETKKWFTFNWPATWHIVWTVMPVTAKPGAPEIGWSVEVERASPEFATYWITAKNLTGSSINFEGRFAILSFY